MATRTAMLTSLIALAVGCGDGEARRELDISICEPDSGKELTLDGHNEFFPLVAGTTLVLEGEDEGAAVHLEIWILDETEEVLGVTTRVLEERESEDGELVEISRNFFAHTSDETVCYFGEDVDIYENGEVVSHEGAWRAGEGDNRPGIFMPAQPAVGLSFAQEVAPGVAEDRVEIVARGEPLSVPTGDYENTLEFLETTPLEPGVQSRKVFVGGIGLAVDDVVELVEIRPPSTIP